MGLKKGTIQIIVFQEYILYACSSRCFVTYALREYQSHSDGMLSDARKSLDAASLILASGGRSDAVLAEVEKIRKALWLIDHGKAAQKAGNGGKPCS